MPRFTLHYFAAVLTLVTLLGAIPAKAGTPSVEICDPKGGKTCGPCPDCSHVIDLDAHVDNEHEFYGRTMLKVINLDPVRCVHEFKGDTAFSAASDLSGILKTSTSTPMPATENEKVIPLTADEVSTDATNAQPSSPDSSLPNAFLRLEQEAETMNLATELKKVGTGLEKLEKEIREALAASRASNTRLEAQLQQAVGFLGAPRGDHTPDEASNQADSIEATLRATPWTPQSRVQELRKSLREFLETLYELPRTTPGFAEWYASTQNARAYDKSVESIERMLADLAVLDHGSEEYAKYTSLRKDLASLRDQLREAAAMSTEQYIHVRCGRPFSKTKTVKVLYTCTPRKPPSEVKADDPKPTPVLLGTVVCPSALSVTAGLSVTGLKERNFQFVESVEPAVLDENGQEVSPAMLVERVGTSESSDEQVNPFTLGHVRFWDSRSRGLGLHASLGPLFDFDDNEVKLGFATGVSLSVRDNFFFTLGVALGRETHLDGGFELGDLKVGESMEIPTTSSWEQTYFVGVSYKVNQ